MADQETKKRGRKGRKQNEKEIMKEVAKDLNQSYSRSRSNSLVGHQMETAAKVQGLLSETALHQVKEGLARPKTALQGEYIEAMKNPTKKIVFATGPAGTGKTMLACQQGLYHFLSGQYEKLVFTRPMIAVDEEMGFLPGTMEEKMAPWIRPMWDVLGQQLSQREIQVLMDEKYIEIVPLGFMRGRTFIKTWIVADEMQNATENQMKMLTTRLGTGSKMVITGDLDQCDLPKKYAYNRPVLSNGLADLLERIRRTGKPLPPTIQCFAFQTDDVQREAVVKDILKIYAETDADA
jgi:phosphate starvation-inducible PhoH-like protein